MCHRVCLCWLHSVHSNISFCFLVVFSCVHVCLYVNSGLCLCMCIWILDCVCAFCLFVLSECKPFPYGKEAGLAERDWGLEILARHPWEISLTVTRTWKNWRKIGHLKSSKALKVHYFFLKDTKARFEDKIIFFSSADSRKVVHTARTLPAVNVA